MIALTSKAQQLYDVLAEHAVEKPIKARKLETALHMDERAIRDLVVELRRWLRGKGKTVISGSYGYRLSNNAEEIAIASSRLKKHAIAELMAARDIACSIDGLQTSLNLDFLSDRTA